MLVGSPPSQLSRHRRSLADRSGTFYDYFAEIYIFWHQRYCFASTNQTDKGGHLSLIAPSSVSFSTRDGGTFGGPQFFPFSSAESHENCLYFKVAPVINDKKHPKHLVVTGALHVIQWIWGPQNHPSKSLLWVRQLKKCAWDPATAFPGLKFESRH